MKLPNPIELLSYTLYTQGCALGVFFEYSDYIRFIERTGEYDAERGGALNPIFVGLLSLLKAIVFLGLYVASTIYIPYTYTYTVEYGEKSIAYRIAYFMAAGYGIRLFYYGPFNFTTAAIQASGFGYNG